MSVAALERVMQPDVVPVVTPEQVALIKSTIAQGATDAELKLFFYDCSRRGVHPLDRLIHFTKRGGKYTPITSIDFMRTRAHETDACAGISDALFIGEPGKPGFQATVTVRRVVGSHRAPFTATARWEEYKPESNDFMWKRMPHTMLGKCAEALALRKAFPQQLSGLYAREEMDQAGSEPVVTGEVSQEVRAERPTPPAGACYIEQVTKSETKNKNVFRYVVTFSTGEQASTINQQLAGLAEQLAQGNEPVTFTAEESKFGWNLTKLERAIQPTKPVDKELADSDIPF